MSAMKSLKSQLRYLFLFSLRYLPRCLEWSPECSESSRNPVVRLYWIPNLSLEG